MCWHVLLEISQNLIKLCKLDAINVKQVTNLYENSHFCGSTSGLHLFAIVNNLGFIRSVADIGIGSKSTKLKKFTFPFLIISKSSNMQVNKHRGSL
jgi:hypothetical protein